MHLKNYYFSHKVQYKLAGASLLNLQGGAGRRQRRVIPSREIFSITIRADGCVSPLGFLHLACTLPCPFLLPLPFSAGFAPFLSLFALLSLFLSFFSLPFKPGRQWQFLFISWRFFLPPHPQSPFDKLLLLHAPARLWALLWGSLEWRCDITSVSTRDPT